MCFECLKSTGLEAVWSASRFHRGNLNAMLKRCDPERLTQGSNQFDGEDVFFCRNFWVLDCGHRRKRSIWGVDGKPGSEAEQVFRWNRR